MSAEPAAVSPEKSAVTAVSREPRHPSREHEAEARAPARPHRVFDARRRRAHGRASRAPPRWACLPSRRRTTATSSAPTSSGPRRAPTASSRSSASRPTSRPAPTAATTPVRWGDETAGRDDVSGGGITHMTLLARARSCATFFPDSSLASMEGRSSRASTAFLSLYSDGLIATTGCVGGEIQTRLARGSASTTRPARPPASSRTCSARRTSPRW